MNNHENMYEANYVSRLFDKMSTTYGITNYISSFGFTERWRKQCVKEINWNAELNQGYDLMSGMGESWYLILKEAKVNITGVDISPKMNRKASEKLVKNVGWDVEIREENVLDNTIKSESADFVISTFGLKTFSQNQLKELAKEVVRILRKGGQIAMIEISVPNNFILKTPYMFYLKRIIPIIGRIFQGDSNTYKMLGIYCEKFENCKSFGKELENLGLNIETKSYFFGCATGIVGYK